MMFSPKDALLQSAQKESSYSVVIYGASPDYLESIGAARPVAVASVKFKPTRD
jgi:hypothetical protein